MMIDLRFRTFVSGRKVVTGMRRLCRAIATATVASGLLVASAVAVAAASPATYRVTIGARSMYPGGPIAGKTLVIYGTARFDTATIAGEVTGFEPGDVATLLAKPFRATRFRADGAPLSLTALGRYSFTVQPSLATQYEVRVSTSGSADVISRPAAVYVTPGGQGTYERISCSGSHCKAVWHVYTHLAAPAYQTEAHKRWYFYLADTRTRPKYLPLIKGTASRPRKISAGEYEVTLTFPYKRRGQNPSPWTLGCTKDSESKDGIGLPRRYHCGDKRVRAESTYLG